jgi:hypothetical protein
VATTLSMSSVKVTVGWDFENVLTLGNTVQQNQFSYSSPTVNGTGLGAADLLYVTTGSLAASAALNLDLAGSLLDSFGNTITMARVKGIYIELQTATAATSVLVGNGANPLINWVGSGCAYRSHPQRRLLVPCGARRDGLCGDCSYGRHPQDSE